jgi:ArsR family transcriptional regulator, arsenate/arsenite/antimonite-responsive transcriptional repressor
MSVDATTLHDASTSVNPCGILASMPTALPLTDDLVACCSPVAAGGLDQASAERLAAVLKALAEPTRLRLISLVAAQPDGEACICDLTEPVALSQPTVSHHMKVLVDAGLLEREQRGRWAYYRLVPGALDSVAATLLVPGGSDVEQDLRP